MHTYMHIAIIKQYNDLSIEAVSMHVFWIIWNYSSATTKTVKYSYFIQCNSSTVPYIVQLHIRSW